MLRNSLNATLRFQISRVPGLSEWLAPQEITETDCAGFRKAQAVALEAVKSVARDLRPGWTEQRAASLVDSHLRDAGVNQFFHHSFAWFGERTRFDGIRGYAEFSPTSRVLQEGDVFILDTAPIVKGYICDIGYSHCFGENTEFTKALSFLWYLRDQIPLWAIQGTGAELYQQVSKAFSESGFECAHFRYPFRVLGHRVHRAQKANRLFGTSRLWNFGLSSFAELSSRLLWDQLLTDAHPRPLRGLWAIEPHLGAKGFGAKFEEILHVTDNKAVWLVEEAEACLPERPLR